MFLLFVISIKIMVYQRDHYTN